MCQQQWLRRMALLTRPFRAQTYSECRLIYIFTPLNAAVSKKTLHSTTHLTSSSVLREDSDYLRNTRVLQVLYGKDTLLVIKHTQEQLSSRCSAPTTFTCNAASQLGTLRCYPPVSPKPQSQLLETEVLQLPVLSTHPTRILTLF